MRAWLDRGALPQNQRLADDLTGIEYGYNADNAILLERKEHMRARGLPSSDWSDALALTFSEDIQPRQVPEYLNPDSWGRTEEYDRYADWDDDLGYDRSGI